MAFAPVRRVCARGAIAMVVAALVAALPAQRAGAQDAGLDEEARSLFAAGRTAFEAGRFESALERFREAYELSGRAALLYNIGTAADRLRRDAEALEAFRAYVAAEPDASNRGEVEARIAVLERAVAAAEPAPAQDVAAPEPEPIALAQPVSEDDRAASGSGGSIAEEWWFWTLIGVVVIGAGVGIGVGVAVSSGDTVQAPLPGTTGSVAIALGAW